jgi:hypothetical protein
MGEGGGNRIFFLNEWELFFESGGTFLLRIHNATEPRKVHLPIRVTRRKLAWRIGHGA